ncbi:ABC transporter [Trichophyton rubrum]|uniref:ABC transporter n=1 Tax=Trichophyton rubrum TaxID=5551 RepID=A0A178F7M3_TRIRU|nr:ABC transporter [Trichophyton rubrum]
MIRWCLVSTIGVKTLQLNTHSVEDPKAAVTLMSTDVERIIFGLRSFHEFWANAIQAGFSASFWRGSLLHTVVKACALVTNIDSLPRGNETIVGSDGINLSGGQKQKIAIARALYALKPILLFDDVLSGLDYTGASHIFREVIGPKGLAQQHGITVIIATHATEYLPFADHIIALDKSGQVIQQGSFQSLRSQSGYIGSLTIAENFEKEETVVNTDQAASKSVGASVNNEKYNENLPIRQSGDFRIYGYYFEAAGIWISCLLLVLVISYATLCIFSTYWMRIWVDTFSFSRPARLDDLGYWAVYTVLQSSALFLLLGVVYHTLIHFVSRAGSSLHRDILDVVINVPLSFFGSTGIGVTINCFSQDIQLVDNELPMALLNWLLTVFLALGQIILIIIASPWVEFAFIDIVLILYTMQNFYLRTSRQLRLLELEAKSPSYSNFLENLNGLSTLRAFGWTAQARWLTFVLDVTIAFLAVIIVTLAVTLKASEHKPGEVFQPPLDWPQHGKIDIYNITAYYKFRLEFPVLRDLNITIEEEQKVGACIYPVTVRFNLDPCSQHSDCEFIEALKKALLFDVISAQGGLDSEFQPSSLSHGQRQLFSLAGATLQKSKIVLLDEITGNVDQARDELMQKIVREEFELCSIIAIAHRLNTNMDFDRVIVLDGGHIVESGKPQDLLSKDFMFKQMWKGDTRHTEHE